tara:strand:+ start:1490 stop:1753 length:264 start_codon:yes stop_codon:yes gene_type:complete
MANGRDIDKMKKVGAFVTVEFKRKLELVAKQRGISVSDLIRDLLAEELGEQGNISSQKMNLETVEPRQKPEAIPESEPAVTFLSLDI